MARRAHGLIRTRLRDEAAAGAVGGRGIKEFQIEMPAAPAERKTMTLEQIYKEIEASGLKFGDPEVMKPKIMDDNSVLACEHMKILRASPESELAWLARYICEEGRLQGGMADFKSCSDCARKFDVEISMTLLCRMPVIIYTSQDAKTDIRRRATEGKPYVARSERGRQAIKDALESN
jgi:hypothetical protein